MRNTWIILATVFILAGCSRSLEQPALMKKGDFFKWSTRACAETTKTSLDGTTLSWVTGDKIGIFIGDIQENKLFVNTVGNNFDGTFIYEGVSAPSINYYAYYPFIYTREPSSTITATLPSEQTAPFDPTANFMVADVESAKYDEADMPSVNFQFNNQLMSIVKLTITDTSGEYAAQQLLSASIEATGGETLAGKFSFDITSPASAPTFSVIPEEVSSSVLSTYPTESRPVLGAGSHSIYFLVNPVTVTALKVIIKTTDNVFVAKTTIDTVFEKGKVISLPTIDLKNIAPQRRIRKLVLWGDSITNTGYRNYVQAQLGSDWEVIRGGIGGDSPLGIAGRQGGIPLCLNNGFVIPASNTESVAVGPPYSTKNTADEAAYISLGVVSAQRYYGDPGGLLNPCTIKFNDGVKDVEIEGTLTDNGNGWDFTRTTSGEEVTVPAKATLLTYGAKAYKDADVIVIYMGANGGYKTDNVLASFYQQMIDYTVSKKAIVVGFHMGYIHFPAGSEKTYWTEDFRDIFRASFGDNFLDLKTEGVTNASKLLVETGAYTPGQAFTDADADALANGYWPQSFASTNNYSDVHFNGYGSKAMAILVRQKMKDLGYLDYN